MTQANHTPSDQSFLDVPATVNVRVAQTEAENAEALAQWEEARRLHEERKQTLKTLCGNPDALGDLLAELGKEELATLALLAEVAMDAHEELTEV